MRIVSFMLAALFMCRSLPGEAGVSANQPVPFAPSVFSTESHEVLIMTDASDGRPIRSSSRIRAPEVAPVVHQGIRYEQIKAPSSKGLPPGGYVSATEVATGKRVWLAKVYDTALDSNRETDVQIVFFKSLVLNQGGDALLIEDEKQRKYRVSLADGAVQSVP